jgi:hypothetical protein
MSATRKDLACISGNRNPLSCSLPRCQHVVAATVPEDGKRRWYPCQSLEEFARQTIDELLKELPVEKRLELLKAVPPEQLVEAITPERLLKTLSPEQRVEGLSAAELRALADENLLDAITFLGSR